MNISAGLVKNVLLLAPRPVTLVDKINFKQLEPNLGSFFSNMLHQYLVSVAWVLNVKPNRMIDSQNGYHFGNGIIPGLGEIHHRCTWFWNFFTHLGENILQWPMRQIFFVYQRTTLSHTAWRERDAIGRRFLDPWRLKETYFWLGFISRKIVLWRCVYSNSSAKR